MAELGESKPANNEGELPGRIVKGPANDVMELERIVAPLNMRPLPGNYAYCRREGETEIVVTFQTFAELYDYVRLETKGGE